MFSAASVHLELSTLSWNAEGEHTELGLNKLRKSLIPRQKQFELVEFLQIILLCQ